MTEQMIKPTPRPGIMEIAAYVPGKSHGEGTGKVHKLSSNETPLGPSPKAIAAMQSVGEHLALYPDGQSSALREAIAAKYGLNTGNIICGNGSDELLGLIAHVYLGEGDEACCHHVVVGLSFKGSHQGRDDLFPDGLFGGLEAVLGVGLLAMAKEEVIGTRKAAYVMDLGLEVQVGIPVEAPPELPDGEVRP